jgi:hypothetical protein
VALVALFLVVVLPLLFFTFRTCLAALRMQSQTAPEIVCPSHSIESEAAIL